MDGSRQPSAPPLAKNIVLVGRTGNGKSATGNSLIGKEVFISESNATGVTITCQTCQTETPDGFVMNVIDTPGLFDLSESAPSISKEIIKCLTLAEEGLHVVVLVLSLKTRISQEEENTFYALQSLFGVEIINYLIVLFTGGDELEASNKTLDDYFGKGCPEFLKTVFSMCDGRRVVFNNKTTDEGQKVKQVQQFLALVKKIEDRNDGKPLIVNMHREIKEEAERLRQQKKEVEARNLGEAELAEKQQLQISYEKRMSEMENRVMSSLRENSAKHNEMILMLNKNLETLQKENDSLRIEQIQDKKKQMMIQLGLAVPGALGMMGMCSIL